MEKEKELSYVDERLQLYSQFNEWLTNNYQRAMTIAVTYGLVVGEIDVFEPAVLSTEKGKMSFECRIDVLELFKLLETNKQGIYDNNFINLVRWICSVGSYLACVDIKTLELVGLKVIGVKRESISTIVGEKPKTSLYSEKDVSDLITPIRVYVEPLLSLEIESEEKKKLRSINYVLEPKSPVLIPNPDILGNILGIPSDGVTIGGLSNGDLLLSLNGKYTKVRLDKKSLFQHMLIVGTTGAGKTTEVKNLIYELVKNSRGSVLALDPTQELIQMLFPARKEGLKEEYPDLRLFLYGIDVDKLTDTIILLPITAKKAERFNNVKELAEDYYTGVIKPLIEVHKDKVGKVSISVTEKEIILKWLYEGTPCTVTIIPYALKFDLDKLEEKLIQVNPFFTERAKVAIPIIFRKLREDKISFSNLKELAQKMEENFNELVYKRKLVASSTLENVIRNVYALDDWGLFNVKVGNMEISEVTPDKYLREGYLTIVDLRYSMEDIYSQCAFIYHILDTVFRWKRESRIRGESTPDVFIVIDEAHNYFPQKGLLEEESVRLIAGKLQKIAREGRKEGLSLILATQFPRDVHDVVRSLCNTKIIFRVDKKDLEVLDLPKEYEELATRMQDLTAIVKSPVGLRIGYLTIKVPLPITEHVDLSAIKS